MRVLLLNHNLSPVCGVHAHGVRMAKILEASTKHQFVYAEAGSVQEFHMHLALGLPDVVIVNYHPATMPWMSRAAQPEGVRHIGMIHEVVQATVDGPIDPLFDAWVCTDPSLSIRPGSGWHQTVRPIFAPRRSPRDPEAVPVIGSFGFAFGNKGFDRLAQAVNDEFDHAILRMHVTRAHFHGGLHDANPLVILDRCKRRITKSGIQLEFSTDHRSDEDVVSFLQDNTINALLYDTNPGRGISSAVDYCVSAGRPLILSESEQFRHVDGPFWPHTSFKEAIEAGTSAVEHLQKAWGHDVFVKQYEKIVDSA